MGVHNFDGDVRRERRYLRPGGPADVVAWVLLSLGCLLLGLLSTYHFGAVGTAFAWALPLYPGIQWAYGILRKWFSFRGTAALVATQLDKARTHVGVTLALGILATTVSVILLCGFVRVRDDPFPFPSRKDHSLGDSDSETWSIRRDVAKRFMSLCTSSTPEQARKGSLDWHIEELPNWYEPWAKARLTCLKPSDEFLRLVEPGASERPSHWKFCFRSCGRSAKDCGTWAWHEVDTGEIRARHRHMLPWDAMRNPCSLTPDGAHEGPCPSGAAGGSTGVRHFVQVSSPWPLLRTLKVHSQTPGQAQDEPLAEVVSESVSQDHSGTKIEKIEWLGPDLDIRVEVKGGACAVPDKSSIAIEAIVGLDQAGAKITAWANGSELSISPPGGVRISTLTTLADTGITGTPICVPDDGRSPGLLMPNPAEGVRRLDLPAAITELLNIGEQGTSAGSELPNFCIGGKMVRSCVKDVQPNTTLSLLPANLSGLNRKGWVLYATDGLGDGALNAKIKQCLKPSSPPVDPYFEQHVAAVGGDYCPTRGARIRAKTGGNGVVLASNCSGLVGKPLGRGFANKSNYPNTSFIGPNDCSQSS